MTFVARHAHDATKLGGSLDLLQVRNQTNYVRGEREEGSPIAYVATYWFEDQKRLFEAVKDQLDEPRRKRLEDLVLARSPVPEELLPRMRATIRSGKSYEYLADRLNELDIVVGMRGGSWTPPKVLLALGFE